MSYAPGPPGITLEQFKRSGDVDDTAAFLRAFDHFKNTSGQGEQAGGTLCLRGGYTISDTLLVQNVGVTLQGVGWGNSQHPTSGTWIKWAGPAGRPMVKFVETFNAGCDNLRLIGNSAAKPSCGIEWADTGITAFYANHMSRVWIGHYYGYDTDNAIQVQNGIICSGTVNGDSNTFTEIVINGYVDVGVDIQNPNFSCTHFDGLFANYGAIGVKIKGAKITGTNWFIGSATDTCFRLLNGAELHVVDFEAEGSARIATFDPAFGKGSLILEGGAFQVQNTIAADGRVIDTGTSIGWNIHLEDFSLQIVDGYTGPVPKIRAYNTAGLTTGSLRLIAPKGVYPINLELGNYIWSNDSRDVIYEPAAEMPEDSLPRMSWQGDYTDTVDRSFRVFTSDQRGEHRLRGGPLIIKKLPVPQVVAASALLGGGATTYSYKVTAITYDGETDPCPEVTCTNGTLAAGTNVNRILWHPMPGAVGYRIYGRTAGSWALIKTLTWDELHPGNATPTVPPRWDDNGSVTPSGAIPTVNATGNLRVEGRINLLTSGAPPAPADGDIWFDGTALKIRIGGATKTVTVA